MAWKEKLQASWSQKGGAQTYLKMDSTLGRSLHPSSSADQKYEKLHRMAPPPDKVSPLVK